MATKKRVLVQAGHLAPREPGISGLGAQGEVELVTKIRDRLVRLLDRDGRFDGIPIPGDVPDGIHVDAALYLHADGATNPTAGGFSFGFPNTAGNRKLAKLIGAEFQKIPGHPNKRADNGTADAAGYYAYKRVNTPHEALVEHGFVTNPSEHAWMKRNAGKLAKAEYEALCKLFGLNGKEKRVKNESVFFLASAEDDEAVKLAKAAARACRELGFDASSASSPKTVARLSKRARDGQLGQHVAFVIGDRTEGLLDAGVRAALRDKNGKWLPTRKSDLWDSTGDAATAKRKLVRRLRVLAEVERKDKQRLTEAFRLAL